MYTNQPQLLLFTVHPASGSQINIFTHTKHTHQMIKTLSCICLYSPPLANESVNIVLPPSVPVDVCHTTAIPPTRLEKSQSMPSLKMAVSTGRDGGQSPNSLGREHQFHRRFTHPPRDDMEALSRIIQICTDGKPLHIAMADLKRRREMFYSK